MAHGSVVAPGAYAPRPTCWWAHLSRRRRHCRARSCAGREMLIDTIWPYASGREAERPARPPRSLRAPWRPRQPCGVTTIDVDRGHGPAVIGAVRAQPRNLVSAATSARRSGWRHAARARRTGTSGRPRRVLRPGESVVPPAVSAPPRSSFATGTAPRTRCRRRSSSPGGTCARCVIPTRGMPGSTG